MVSCGIISVCIGKTTFKCLFSGIEYTLFTCETEAYENAFYLYFRVSVALDIITDALSEWFLFFKTHYMHSCGVEKEKQPCCVPFELEICPLYLHFSLSSHTVSWHHTHLLTLLNPGKIPNHCVTTANHMSAVIAFPVWLLWGIRINLRKKIALGGIFSLVGFTIVATILSKSHHHHHSLPVDHPCCP